MDFKRLIRLVLGGCLIIYVFSAKGYIEVTDTGASLQTAEAIVTRGRLDIPADEGGTLAAPDGKNYSKYGIGLALYYVPIVVLASKMSAALGFPQNELVGFFISFANIPFAMLALILFARLLHHFDTPPKRTWLLIPALGLGTIMWRYAVYDFSEVMQMAFLTLAAYGAIRGTAMSIFVAGTAFASLFLVKLVYAAFLPLFAGYLLSRSSSRLERAKGFVTFLLPFSIAAVFVGYLNLLRFGNVFESGYGREASQFIPSQLWHTIPNLLFSSDKGLFVFCPILLLGLLGWKEFLRRHPREAGLCAGIVLINLLIAAAWHSWIGGWSWGPRLLVPALPFWLLPAAYWLARTQHSWTQRGLALLVTVSIALQLPSILVRDQQVHTIKQTMLSKEELRIAPSDYRMSYILLWHKLIVQTETYRITDFGIPGDRELNFSGNRTLIGFNVWTEQTSRILRKPMLRILPLFGLLFLASLVVFGWTTYRLSLASKDSDALQKRNL